MFVLRWIIVQDITFRNSILYIICYVKYFRIFFGVYFGFQSLIFAALRYAFIAQHDAVLWHGFENTKKSVLPYQCSTTVGDINHSFLHTYTTCIHLECTVAIQICRLLSSDIEHYRSQLNDFDTAVNLTDWRSHYSIYLQRCYLLSWNGSKNIGGHHTINYNRRMLLL
jgi:hypothetical protein